MSPANQALGAWSWAGSGGKVAQGGIEIGLEVQELFEPHQLHRLHDPGIAHHQEVLVVGVALLGQLHQGPEAGGVDEIDMAQIGRAHV